MRRNAVSHFRGTIARPCLLEPRAILRLPRHGKVSTFSGSTSRYPSVSDERKPSTKTKSSSFLKSKAETSKSTSKDGKLGNTVTAAERKVFYGIFNQFGGNGPPKTTRTPPEKQDHFLDHEEILSIFSCAVSRHVGESKAMAEKETAEESHKQRRRALDQVMAREEEVLQRYPKTLRKAARRAMAASLVSEDLLIPQKLEFQRVTNAMRKLEGLGNSTPVMAGRINHDLNKAVELATSKREVDGTEAPPPVFRPSFLIANEQDKDIRRGLPSSVGQPADIAEEQSTTDVHIKCLGLRPSSIRTEHPETHFRRGFRPSFLTTEKRAEDVASFAEHYGAVRPSFVRRAEDAAVVKEKLQHDPESVFQGTIHRYCREEMEKVADSFQSASKRNGDVGIWNTCLAKVFPMIELLDTSFRKAKGLRDQNLIQRKEVQEPPERTTSDKLNPNAPTASSVLSTAESPLPDLPPYVPPLYIISRLYPATLLLAFRHLRTRFPTSPLALALLPQIRSLGPTSYVLGASTEFYNTLIELRWDIYSDLQSIDGLLTEMERNGVEFDLGTWNILVKIEEDRFTDFHGTDGGTRGAGFWGRSCNMRWFQKVVAEWKTVIAARLRDRGLHAEISEREYGAVSLAQAGPSDAEQRTVWL